MSQNSIPRLGEISRIFWSRRAQEARQSPVRTATLSPVCEEEAMILDEVEHQQLSPWLNLGRGKRALELGCGPGRWLRRMARTGAEIVGVEREESFIAEAQRALQEEGFGAQTTLIQRDLNDGLPALIGEFDVILVSLVFVYLHDDAVRLICEGLPQRLKPGGRVIVKESARAIRSEEHYVIEGSEYAALYRSSAEITQMVSSLGLRRLLHEDVRGFPTIDLMEKIARRMGFGSRTNVDRMLSPTGEGWRRFVRRVSPTMVAIWPWLDQRATWLHRRCGDPGYEATQQLWVFERPLE